VSARRRLLIVLTTALAAIATCAAVAPASSARAVQSGFRAACAPAHGMQVTCFARYRTIAANRPSGPSLTPRDIAAAYRLPPRWLGKGTVAIVDAQDDPHAESDLAVYRARFGLPPCTTRNGCFAKVNQHGNTKPLPPRDPGWGVEISLDLDAVSAACPGCHILLVEGNSPTVHDLGVAENTAVRLGADVVSNSYGLDEFNGMQAVGHRFYDHPGVPIIASSGDYGFGIPQFPAVMRTTIAVGGTSLQRANNTRGYTEHVWDGASSGCSGYVAKPAWQTDPHCPTRMVADVSAVADPRSGFLVYDTFGLGGHNGYVHVGGTSLSAPLIAGMVARAGHLRLLTSARYIYRHSMYLHDVRGGSNGYCGDDYLCTGKRGYDGPTGIGSPRGLGAL
jgi:subtilase family serine protease